MRTKRHLVLYALCLPWDLLVAWPVVLLIRLFWGRNLHWETPPYAKKWGGGPVLSCAMRPGTLPVRSGTWPVGWYTYRGADGQSRPWSGTTLGHGVFYGPMVRFDASGWSSTSVHEHVHVEQFEASVVTTWLNFLVASFSVVFGMALDFTGWWTVLFAAAPVWFFSFPVWAAGGWIAAWLRGEQLYRGSQHEESAYAQTQEWKR